ncbi:MAG: hypothetical protein WBP93_05365 [Pyrinomonadaceae bacterium]
MTKSNQKEKLQIPTRAPKPKGDMFANLRTRDQVETVPFEELVAPPATENPLSETFQPPEYITGVPTGVGTPVATPVDAGVIESARERTPYLDATHTPSEKSIYSVMYRETVSKHIRERHFGFKELSEKTGIRSDKTVRVAIDGLLAKLSIEIVSYRHGDPLGPRYLIFDPKEIAKRRKDAGIEIDPQSKKIIGTPVSTGVSTGVPTGGNSYGGTPVLNTPVTGVETTGVYINSSNVLNKPAERSDDDDAALAGLNEALKSAVKELTDKELSVAESAHWRELAEVLIAELKIAAARTTVSSVPAFLAEHLRRRLWKIDKKQARAEGRELPDEAVTAPAPAEQSKDCPDCGGSGWFYPNGLERGVAKCKHENLQKGNT